MHSKMKPIDYFISIIVESLLVYLILVPYGGGDNPWLFIKSLLMMGTPMVLLFAIYHFVLRWDGFIIHFATALGIFVLGMLTGLPIPFAFITAMLLFWRLNDAINGNTLSNIWVIYIATALIAFLYVTFIALLNLDFPHRSWFMLIFFIQTILVIFLHLVQISKNGQFTEKMSQSYMLSFGGIAALAGLFAFIGPYISKGILYVLAYLGMAIFIIVQYFANLIMGSHKEEVGKAFKNAYKNVNNMDDQAKQWAELSNYHPPDSYIWVGVVFVIVAGLIIFYFLRKKWLRDKYEKKKRNVNHQVFNGGLVRAIEYPERKRRLLAPKDPIRLGIFKLQKKLFDQKEGRLGYETVGEWLKRLPFNQHELTSIRTIYEKVRYGKKAVLDEDLKQFNQAIISVTNQIQKPKKKKLSQDEK